MPKCVECGVEVPRDAMFGVGDDLRCANCASKRRRAYSPPVRKVLRVDGYVTIAMIVVAAVAFLGDNSLSIQRDPAQMQQILPPSYYLRAVPELVWSGEFWRLATSAFIHGGILHILFNCYWLWRFGAVIEAWMGRLLYLGFVILLAAASISSEILVHHSTPIGLSGVVYGMFGLLFALRRHKDFAAAVMDPSTVQIMIGWFFLCILLTASGTMNVANFAHGGGAVLGYAIGWASLKRPRIPSILTVVAAGVLVSAAASYMPWDYHYCAFRAREAFAAGDVPGAGTWLDRARQSWNAPQTGEIRGERDRP